MFPLGHATFGYLLYVSFSWTTDVELPHGATLVALLAGTQFPDLLDKPLAFVGLLPSGRTLAHSVFFALVLLVVLRGVTRRYGRPHLAVAFGFGHVSHLVGDVVNPVLDGRLDEIAFLLWPLVSVPPHPGDDVAPWVRIARFYTSPKATDELALVALALVMFVLVENRRRRVVTQ